MRKGVDGGRMIVNKDGEKGEEETGTVSKRSAEREGGGGSGLPYKTVIMQGTIC